MYLDKLTIVTFLNEKDAPISHCPDLHTCLSRNALKKFQSSTKTSTSKSCKHSQDIYLLFKQFFFLD